MKFNIYIVAHTVPSLQERLKKHATIAVRKRMEEPQCWDEARLEKLQICDIKTAHPVAENK